jgi:hypothetical protein
MQPVVRQIGSEARLSLRDLVSVMHRYVVLAPAVDVEERAEVFRGHG